MNDDCLISLMCCSLVDMSVCLWDMPVCLWDMSVCLRDMSVCLWDMSVCLWDMSVCLWDMPVCLWDMSVCLWDMSMCLWDMSVCLWDVSVFVRCVSVFVRCVNLCHLWLCRWKIVVMSAYTKIICPCTTGQARYNNYSPDTLTPPSGSYSPSLSLGTGISAHWCSLYASSTLFVDFSGIFLKFRRCALYTKVRLMVWKLR
jgi:hypothetical protein